MSKTSARTLLALERAQKAWDLRKTGATLDAIGKVLGISAQAVHKAILKYEEQAKKDLTADMSLEKRMALDRLDALLLAIWPKARAGDLKAVAEARALGAERAKLLGLYAPIKSALTDPSGEKPAGNFVLPLTASTPEEWLAMVTNYQVAIDTGKASETPGDKPA